MADLPQAAIQAAAEAIGLGMVIRRPPRELAIDALAAAAPHLAADVLRRSREVGPETTVYVVRNPSGSPWAIFASQELADAWIGRNHLKDAYAEAWHVHTEIAEREDPS